MSIVCEDYSEKAIVLRGEETKNFIEELKQLRGKYNANLKGGGGWIFSKSRKGEVEAFLEKANVAKKGVKPVKPTKTVEKVSPSRPIAPDHPGLILTIADALSHMSSQEKLYFLSHVAGMAVRAEKCPEPKEKLVVACLPSDEEEEEEDESEDSQEESEEESKPRSRLLK